MRDGSGQGPPTSAAFARKKAAMRRIGTSRRAAPFLLGQHLVGDEAEAVSGRAKVRHAARRRQHQRHHAAVGAARRRDALALAAIANAARQAAAERRKLGALGGGHRRQAVGVVGSRETPRCRRPCRTARRSSDLQHGQGQQQPGLQTRRHPSSLTRRERCLREKSAGPA